MQQREFIRWTSDGEGPEFFCGLTRSEVMWLRADPDRRMWLVTHVGTDITVTEEAEERTEVAYRLVLQGVAHFVTADDIKDMEVPPYE